VDYERRRGLFEEMKSMMGDDAASRVMERAEDGMPKMWTIFHALQLRREHPEWFGPEVAYTPLIAEGAKRDHVIAYLRGDAVATVVPRLTARLLSAWRDTSVELPEGRWRNRLTGELVTGGRVAMKSLLKDFPVALLVKETNDA
jgi:(1->4)-alpha-D-glucan 1-alpha-D-glucosylmutase